MTSNAIHASAAAAEAVFVVAKASVACADGAERRPRVEAEPSEPEHAGPEDHERNVGRHMRSDALVNLPAAEHHRADERGQAGGRVDDRPAGEVQHAPLAEEPVRVPGPVRERTVDEEAEQADERDVAPEPHALGERPGDQRRRDDGELQVEEREEHQRDGGRQRCVRAEADVLEHEERARIADDAAEAVAEREAEADDHPEQADDDHRDQALEHRRDDVLLLDHAAVEERQAGRHQQHEAARGEHPGDVARVDRPTLRLSPGRMPGHGQHTRNEHQPERDCLGGPDAIVTISA